MEQLNHQSELGHFLDGIGDTIRISLSDDPVEEVKVGNEILKSLNLRNRGVKIISCPSCARQGFQVIETVKILEKRLSHIKTPITLSVIRVCCKWTWRGSYDRCWYYWWKKGKQHALFIRSSIRKSFNK